VCSSDLSATFILDEQMAQTTTSVIRTLGGTATYYVPAGQTIDIRAYNARTAGSTTTDINGACFIMIMRVGD
jgi:hypothetical protein